MSNTNCYHNSKRVLSAVKQEFAEQHGQEVPEEYGLVLHALVLTLYGERGKTGEIEYLADVTEDEAESDLAAFVVWFLNNDLRYRVAKYGPTGREEIAEMGDYSGDLPF